MRVRGRDDKILAATLPGLLLVAFLAGPAWAGPQLNPADPVGFFTNLASRLLKQEMGLDLHHLQIHPTNQYTPAVHRLLQVSANIYEATTNRFDDDYPHLPTVFRPRFSSDGTNVFIRGYVEETNAAFLGNPLRDLCSATIASMIQPDDLVLGIPVVIGAKQGLPNFNEFSSETVVQISRRVELVKSAPGGAGMIFQTNQMLIIGISNNFGAEFWNSYARNYPRPVEVAVTTFCQMSLTNDYGYQKHLVVFPTPFGKAQLTNWQKWSGLISDPSLIVPLRFNYLVLPDSVYRQASASFVPDAVEFERPSGFEFPRWGLTLTNRVLAYIKDQDSGRLIDGVLLNGMSRNIDISLEVAEAPPAAPSQGGFGALWATNALDPNALPKLGDFIGVRQQILVSGGDNWGYPPQSNWQNYGIGPLAEAVRDQAIANFLAFFENSGHSVYYASGRAFYGTNSSLVTTLPFTPTKKFSLQMFWQANDPLVHYHSGELMDRASPANDRLGKLVRWLPPSLTTNTLGNLGRVNLRYRPWGGYPYLTSPFDQWRTAFQPAVKDAAIRGSDDWQFPINEPPTLEWLGRLHRGTPWQTIYLKSDDISDSDWSAWSANADPNDFPHSKPKRDWPLVALIASLLNTNRPQDLLSINSTDTHAWLAALDGISVLTNSASDSDLWNNGSGWFDELTITSNSAQAAVIEQAIRSARAAQPNQYFRNLGDLLATPELSVYSPFLNRGGYDEEGHNVQLELGLTDEAYERIPSQLLSRLRADSVGSIQSNPNGTKVRFTGQDGQAYVVEGSTNLTDWSPVSTNQPNDGWFEVFLPLQGEQSFYRSALLP